MVAWSQMRSGQLEKVGNKGEYDFKKVLSNERVFISLGAHSVSGLAYDRDLFELYRTILA